MGGGAKRNAEELEQELERSLRNFRAIGEYGRKITGLQAMETVLQTGAKAVQELVDVDKLAIGLYDEPMGVLEYRLIMEDGRLRPLHQVSVEEDGGIASAVIRAGKELMTETSLCCPLMLADRVTGVLTVQRCEPAVYSELDIETLKVLAAFVSAALGSARQADELNAKARELELASRTDPLTGLGNRRHILEMIEQERVRQRRNERPFSVALCDIDHFKKVNDVYGHDCGDAVLKALAGLLARHIRKQDALARWGGEEFLLLLPETPAEGAAVLAEKLRRRVGEYEFTYAGLTLPLTMTFGVAQYNDEYGVDACIVGADSALYKGKNDGRNRVVVF